MISFRRVPEGLASLFPALPLLLLLVSISCIAYSCKSAWSFLHYCVWEEAAFWVVDVDFAAGLNCLFALSERPIRFYVRKPNSDGDVLKLGAWLYIFVRWLCLESITESPRARLGSFMAVCLLKSIERSAACCVRRPCLREAAVL